MMATGNSSLSSTKLLTGNYAVAYAVRACRVQVVAAYPITPQTTVVEKVADLVAAGEMPAKLIKVESEHSSMAACIGASAVGARVFTATSSHGLAYMHEMLYWAAGHRLPIVMVNANRSLAAPWNLGVDQLDSLAQRDTGWLQFYCENNQEVLDTVIQAYRLSEAVSVPTMVSLDGFFVSHTIEKVIVPEPEMVDRFLPPREPLYTLDPADPASFGGTCGGDEYTQFRHNAYQATLRAGEIGDKIFDQYAQVFGRRYRTVETSSDDGDAEVALVSMGSVIGTARQVVSQMRAEGRKVKLVKIRQFRPFPRRELRDALRGAKKIAVIDRDLSLGTGGILAQELKAALYDGGTEPRSPIFDFVAGLGGVDITPEKIRSMMEYALDRETPEQDLIWVETRP